MTISSAPHRYFTHGSFKAGEFSEPRTLYEELSLARQLIQGQIVPSVKRHNYFLSRIPP